MASAACRDRARTASAAHRSTPSAHHPSFPPPPASLRTILARCQSRPCPVSAATSQQGHRRRRTHASAAADHTRDWSSPAAPSKSGCSGIHIRVIQSGSQISSVPLLWNIASVLGSAFWDGEMVPLLSSTERSPAEKALDGIRMRLYGMQLTAQLLMMHIVYFDSTVSVLAVSSSTHQQRRHHQQQDTDSHTDGPSASTATDPLKDGGQVVGTAMLQLRVSGQELHEALGVAVNQCVLIISNVAVAPEMQGQGIGRKLLRATETAAIEIFCRRVAERHASQQQKQQQQKQQQQEQEEQQLTDEDVALARAAAGHARLAFAPTPADTSREGSCDARGDGSESDASASPSGAYNAWWQREIPQYAILVVYKDNLAARRLYESLGWAEATTWKDKVWEREAQKGRPGGRPRRLLYYKQLLAVP